jgi:steroid Delta-isomerase
MASKESIQSAIAAYFGALRAMAPNGFADAFAPNGVTHDPVGTPPHMGRDAIRQFLQGILDGCVQFGLSEDHVFIAGNSAAIKWSGHLTAKNGRSIAFEGVDVLEVNDEGKIQMVRAYLDPAPVLAVLQG